MAVNKNFVVKNGLEVDTNTLFVDSANNRVAIGTTVPTAALDVRGKILSDSQVESFVGKFVGIVTAGAVGVTTMTTCLLYTSPSPRDMRRSRMPSSA